MMPYGQRVKIDTEFVSQIDGKLGRFEGFDQAAIDGTQYVRVLIDGFCKPFLFHGREVIIADGK